MKTCPYCKKDVPDEVRKCSCGYDFFYVESPEAEKSVVSKGKAVDVPVMTRGWIFALVTLPLLVLLGLNAFSLSSNKRTSLAKYEYKVVAPSDATFESEMNKYGEEGWSIVSARRALVDSSASPSSYEIILQRMK